MNGKKLLVIDMDGTLVNTERRFQECQKISQNNKKAFWNCFQSEQFMYLDTSIQSVISFVKSLPADMRVVVSGRAERQRAKTIEQLNTIGISVDNVYLRGEKDFRKDYEYKASVIEQILKENLGITDVILIDDSQEVLQFVPNYIKSKFNVNISVIDAKTLY